MSGVQRNPHQSLLIGNDRNDRSVISPVSDFPLDKRSREFIETKLISHTILGPIRARFKSKASSKHQSPSCLLAEPDNVAILRSAASELDSDCFLPCECHWTLQLAHGRQ